MIDIPTTNIPEDVKRIIDRLVDRIPLLGPHTPEGWVDFREGYNRGWRGGIFVKCDSLDHDLVSMKSAFDTQEDALLAYARMETLDDVILTGIPENQGGIWMIRFDMRRDAQL